MSGATLRDAAFLNVLRPLCIQPVEYLWFGAKIHYHCFNEESLPTSPCVKVHTDSLKHSDYSLSLLHYWLHLNIQSGEVGAGEHHCRGHCQKEFFLSFLLICFLHAVCECPIADICCVHVFGPLASYSRRCRMLISPYPCCYVTALIFFPHLTVITQKCHASLTLSAHLLPNHVHERQ